MTNTTEQTMPAVNKGQESQDGRHRHWALLVYPESAPMNWKELLDAECVPWVCSPLHDSDLWTPEDERECAEHTAGTPKKAHWHVGIFYSGKVGIKRVKAIADILHAPYPKPVNDTKAFVRYMAHMDTPQKHQYNPADIEAHCGADIFRFLQMSDSEEDEALNIIEGVILDCEVTEYYELFKGYSDNAVMKRVIRSHSYHLCQLIRSIREFKRTNNGRSIHGNNEAGNIGEQSACGAEAGDDCGGVQDDEA